VARAAGDAPRSERPRTCDLLLDGTAAGYNAGYAAAAPILRKVLANFGNGMSTEEQLHFHYITDVTAMRLWESDRWEELSTTHLQLARETGALSEMPLALTSRTFSLLFAGELTAASALADETQAVKEATGSNLASYGALGVAAFRGEEKLATALLGDTLADVNQRGEGIGISFAEWAAAVLYNGLGRYAEALAAAQRATAYRPDQGSLVWMWPELIEAAVRTGSAEIAAGAVDRLTEMAEVSGTDWALGLQARSRALLSSRDEADALFSTSITHLSMTRMRVDLARSHLLYGEWLRRERRRTDARQQLRTAHDMFAGIGVAGFAQRAARELRATGEAARKRSVPVRHEQLTAQEEQIARLARAGLSNPEIGIRLFLSTHTVQYHLRKVFAKLGIVSRGELSHVLREDPAVR
jgi:DNA-binding CsgD family transcriptional regulator